MKLIAAVFALLLTIPALQAAVHPDGEYVVILNGNADPGRVKTRHGVGTRPLGRDKVWNQVNNFHGFSARLNGNQADRLEADADVAIIETNSVLRASAQTIPTGVRRIYCQSNALWQASAVTPINADIAIIDTGIYLTHPDLNVIESVTFVSGTVNGNDDNGHGTHVAGIAAALNNTIGVVGVAPGARLHAVKVMNSTGGGNMADVISGVDWVTQHAATIEVANMSITGQGSSDALRTAITAAVNAGVVFVVSAGNDHFEIYGNDFVFGTGDDFFPASYPECLTVSALADSDGVRGGVGAATSYGADDTLATFSNYSKSVTSINPVISPGAAIDVAAPGVHIYSTVPPLPQGWTTCTNCNPSGYMYLDGTSMAAPHVTGAVALYVAQFGRANNAAQVYAIRQTLINCAEPQSSWGINPTNPFPTDHNPEGLVDVSHFGSASVYPIVKIVSPQANSYPTTTTLISFSGTCIDPAQGDQSANLVWSSSLTGYLFTGASSNMTLSAGTHRISATWTNALNYIGRDTVANVVVGAGTAASTVTITTPADGATFATTDLIAFAGAAAGTAGNDLSSKIQWYSDYAGLIGSGAAFSTRLSPPATHNITAQVVDVNGIAIYTNISLIITGAAVPPANNPPVVSISQPLNGSSFPQGTAVVAAGTASDVEDGDLTSAIQWNDSSVGTLGVSASVSYTPTLGAHTVTASVQDSAGAVATASVAFSIYATNANTTPVVVITSPPNNTAGTVGVAQTFTGTSTDAEEGALTNIIWNDSLEGVIGGGLSITFAPTVGGTHIVTASSTDTNNATGSAQIFWLVATPPPPVTNTPPSVTITAPASGTIAAGTVITCTGTATDTQQGDMTSNIVWNDSLQGFIGSGGTVQYTPIAGSHTLSAKVIDNGGLQGTATKFLTVTAPAGNLTVTVTALPAIVQAKQKEKITATVTCSSTNVPNATVRLSITGANGKVVNATPPTTIANGTTTYQLANPKSKLGAGVATVRATVSATGYNNGVSVPVTFQVLP